MKLSKKSLINNGKMAIVIFLIVSVILVSFVFSCAPKNISEITSSSQETPSSESPQTSIAQAEEASSSQSTEITQEENISIEEIKAEFEIIRTEESDYLKIFKFIDENIGSADVEFADEMIDFAMQFSENEMFAFQERYADPKLQQKIWDDFEGSTDLEILKNADDDMISQLAAETLERKYKLESSEGYVSPVVDYSAYKSYSMYISEQMNSFIDIMALESDKTSIMDAAIVIPLDEFVDRIVMLYDFEEKYPGFIRIYYIVNMLNAKLWIYMGGIDNTPVFNYSNNAIIQERLDDFKANALKYEGARFGDKLSEYLELLESENYMLTQKVAEYIDNITFY